MKYTMLISSKLVEVQVEGMGVVLVPDSLVEYVNQLDLEDVTRMNNATNDRALFKVTVTEEMKNILRADTDYLSFNPQRVDADQSPNIPSQTLLNVWNQQLLDEGWSNAQRLYVLDTPPEKGETEEDYANRYREICQGVKP